ncbi:ribbon-helix-helix domain-containing protein [Geoalkalibacter halelectricus]|uniref:ribbon-helix-helix domain-containing protein n=1 Tax=Geoalkalibacter halelectricus TaxID=2847045 RepID=UPI002670976A|nr:type II toxin-antitoxin system ParD family antitoxin [Geoalkalibacter halelectricus]
MSYAIAEGRHGSASEALRDGLRLHEKRDENCEIPRKALFQGEQSGPENYALNDLNRELDEVLG